MSKRLSKKHTNSTGTELEAGAVLRTWSSQPNCQHLLPTSWPCWVPSLILPNWQPRAPLEQFHQLFPALLIGVLSSKDWRWECDSESGPGKYWGKCQILWKNIKWKVLEPTRAYALRPQTLGLAHQARRSQSYCQDSANTFMNQARPGD